MKESRIDIDSLVEELDAKRRSKDISWRKLAEEVGVYPSTLTRIKQGRSPDMATFTALVRWLGMAAEDFIAGPHAAKDVESEPLALASTLLKGKKKLSPQARKALKDLVEAAYRFAQETQ
jgi:transcriptional regulator with XRE-family HTH domain